MGGDFATQWAINLLRWRWLLPICFFFKLTLLGALLALPFIAFPSPKGMSTSEMSLIPLLFL